MAERRPEQVSADEVPCLSRTIHALAKYDARVPRLESMWRGAKLERALAREGASVGVTLAHDLVGLADAVLVRRVRPGAWLRRFLRDWARAVTRRKREAARALVVEAVVVEAVELEPMPRDAAYLALRSAATAEDFEGASERRARERREHEQDDCPLYLSCLNRAAERNDLCLPCGRGPTKTMPGCPRLPGGGS